MKVINRHDIIGVLKQSIPIIFYEEFMEKNKHINKIAAIYIRVSTDAQAEEGYSIDAQKEQLAAYCVSKGIKNYEFYIDGGWSGSNINRPEIQRLIKNAQDGKISHCIVYKLDRLSRSQKDTLYLIEDVFIPNEVSFVSLNETLDTSTPMGKLMIGILSAFAQLERENIRLRTRMGMKERVKDGYWMGGGRIPFGYDYDKNQGILVPNNDADKVRKIYSLYIDGKSPQAIADILDLKYDKLVMQILTRKSNYGAIEYNGEEYKGRHEAIISKEIYDKAIKCMNERSINKVAFSKHLLTGLVYCGHCGAKMRYQKWGKNGCKLVCYSQQTSKKYLIKDENCVQERVWAHEVEEAVLNYLFSLKEDENGDIIDTSNIEETDIIKELQENYDLCQKKIKRLYNLYAESENNLLLETIQEQREKLKEIEDKIKEEQIKRKNLDQKINTAELVTNLQETWKYMSIEEQQTTLRMLINRITINDNNINIDLK